MLPGMDLVLNGDVFQYTSKLQVFSWLADLTCNTLVAIAASVSSEGLFSSAGSLSSGIK